MATCGKNRVGRKGIECVEVETVREDATWQ